MSPAGALFQGVPSPVKQPEKVNMVIFRENTEDIYAGIEYPAGSPEAKKVLDFMAQRIPQGVQEDPFRHYGAGPVVAEVARVGRLAAPAEERSRSASASSR